MTEPASLIGAERRTGPDELEAGLNALIERRAANAEHADDPETREPSYQESVRQYHAEEREAFRHMWISYYRRLACNHAGIAEHFEDKARDLLKEGV